MNNNLISSLFVHLGHIYEFLNASKNDTSMDRNSKSAVLSNCFTQILKLLLILFKWFEKNVNEHSGAKNILKDFMFKLNKLSLIDTSSILCSNPDTHKYKNYKKKSFNFHVNKTFAFRTIYCAFKYNIL